MILVEGGKESVDALEAVGSVHLGGRSCQPGLIIFWIATGFILSAVFLLGLSDNVSAAVEQNLWLIGVLALFSVYIIARQFGTRLEVDERGVRETGLFRSGEKLNWQDVRSVIVEQYLRGTGADRPIGWRDETSRPNPNSWARFLGLDQFKVVAIRAHVDRRPIFVSLHKYGRHGVVRLTDAAGLIEPSGN